MTIPTSTIEPRFFALRPEREDAEQDRSTIVITVGDELLSGRVANRNAVWLTRQFTRVGLEVRRVIVLPDDRSEIASTVRACAKDANLVVVVGGLGGTTDDVTREAIADAFGVDLVLDSGLARWVASECRWVNRDFAMRIARIPRGARVLPNPLGGAFPFQLRNVLALPGMPEELHSIIRALEPELRQPTRDSVTEISCATTEDRIATVLKEFATNHPAVRLGSYPIRVGEFPRLKLVLRCRNRATLRKAAAWLRNEVSKAQPGPAVVVCLPTTGESAQLEVQPRTGCAQRH